MVLRLAFVQEIPNLNFRNLVHGHSHTALIGWGYMALMAALLAAWGHSFSRKKAFSILFWLNEISVLGMYFTFPIYGYKGIPIFFTSVHLILSYILGYLFISELKKSGQYSLPLRFVRSAVFFQILSTVGIWVLPIIVIQGARNSAAYHMAVQFFLHFQFNGWFIFAVLGLLFKYLQDHSIKLSQHSLLKLHHYLFAACLLTYALAVTWSQPVPIIFWINSLGILLQLIALGYLLKMTLSQKASFRYIFSQPGGPLITLAAMVIGLKIWIQAAVIIPSVAVMAYTNKEFCRWIHSSYLAGYYYYLFDRFMRKREGGSILKRQVLA